MNIYFFELGKFPTMKKGELMCLGPATCGSNLVLIS